MQHMADLPQAVRLLRIHQRIDTFSPPPPSAMFAGQTEAVMDFGGGGFVFSDADVVRFALLG